MSSSETGVLGPFEAYVKRFDGELGKGTGYGWTPYRFCSEDSLLAIAVVRATRHSYEVALFGCEDHCDFEPDSGLKAALSFMLADSFHRTGKMEIRFCGPRRGEDGDLDTGFCRGIPKEIRVYAQSLGVAVGTGRVLSHEDGQRLYQKMVGLGETLAKELSDGGVDATRAAFLLHRGAIGLESLSLTARYSATPRAVLEGRLVPDRWLAFKRELVLMRKGLLAERVRVLVEQAAVLKDERVSIDWADDSSLLVTAESPLSVSTETGGAITVEKGTSVQVLLCPADQTELRMLRLKASVLQPGPRFVVFTRDFSWLSADQQRSLARMAKESGMEVIRIFESLDELDSEALLRLERFATTRAAIEEQRE
jgi:hypothetical protein